MTLAEQFKCDHPSLSDQYDIAGMVSIMLTNNGIQWSDEGSYAIHFDDGSTYSTYIISSFFLDNLK